ncbi:MAG: hypothetical protein EPGJADBJ_01497 [Saprospiraceae bacterium]|nr:hypothetical protein [Saprospiraceae bacterium]
MTVCNPDLPAFLLVLVETFLFYFGIKFSFFFCLANRVLKNLPFQKVFTDNNLNPV